MRHLLCPCVPDLPMTLELLRMASMTQPKHTSLPERPCDTTANSETTGWCLTHSISAISESWPLLSSLKSKQKQKDKNTLVFVLY